MMYVWLGIVVVSLILEFLTTEMITIWFAGGGLVSMILAMLSVEYYVQIPVFIIVSIVLLICFRKIVINKFSIGESNLNADAVIGREAILLSEITFEKPGTIKVNDVIWGVISKNEKAFIPENTVVKIVGLKGNKYIVEEAKKC